MAEDTHETKIIISGDANGATNAFNKVIGVLGTVRSAVNRVMQAFGLFGLAVQGVQMLVNGFQKLRDRLTETAREVAKFKWDIEMRNAANETARLVGWHEKLTKALKNNLDELTKIRALEDIDEQGRKDYSDGEREARRAKLIFEAKTPEEEQRLRDTFAREDEQRALEESKSARQKRISRLDDEAWKYSNMAQSLRDNNKDIDEQLTAERFNLDRASNDDVAAPILKRIGELERRKKANEEEIASHEKEAKFRRDQIAALEKQKDYEGITAGEWNRRTEAKKRAEEEAKDKAEAEKKSEEESARKEKARVSAENSEKLERARGLDSFAARLAAQEGVSSNRLTAMGLGSGVQGSGGMAGDVKRLVRLLEDEIAATKEIDTSSTFGD